MSYPELNHLARAEQLFSEGKLDEALEILNDESHFEGYKFERKSHFQFLKGLIFFYQNKSLSLIELGQNMLKEGQEFKENLHSFDGMYFICVGLDQDNKLEEGMNRIREAETFLGNISNITKKERNRREFRLNVLKTMIDIHTGNMDTAEKSLEELLHSQDEHEITWELLWAITNMAYIQQLIRGRFDIALEYIERAMSLTKKLKCNHFWLGYCHGFKGVIHMQKCEYDMGLKHHLKSLEYFEKINNNWYIAHIYNNLGNLYCVKGEHDNALKYLEEAIILWKPYPLMKEACLDSIIWVSLDKGDDVRAQKYFQYLEDIYNKNKTPRIEVIYKYNKALILKTSSRIRDKAKAEELFKEILENEALNFERTIDAYVNLCDLLLAEYRINNNNEVLEEIKHYINKLLNLAENSHAYYIFCETFILQAKLALLNFDMKTARRLLTQAQKIVESYGLNLLTMKISHEHDELIKQKIMWEKLKESNVSLPERLKLAGISEQMENMIKKRMAEVPKLEDEDPLLLLIVSEGGIPTFSKLFTETIVVEQDLISSFLTAFNTFSAELFSEGLDRASFGDFTVLMKPISTFLVCYLFKGQSFSAQKRIKSFVEDMRNNEELLERFNQYYKTNQVVKLEDVPLLNSLIIETFIKKKNF